MKSFFVGFLMLMVGPLWALSEARLLNLSTSGQTALFNLGVHDNVREGEFAVIAKQIRDLETADLRIVPVARARNIKINPDSSVWLLYRITDVELLIKGQKFLILSESGMLRGRRDRHFGRTKVVGKKNEPVELAKKALTDEHEDLPKLKDEYRKSEILHEKTPISATDGTLIDLEGWEKVKGERYRVALYKSPNQKEFRRRLRLATFEKMVTNYLRKVNDPGFNYDAFYDEQMREEYFNEFRKKSNFETEYKEYLAGQAARARENAKFQRTLLEKGEVWSEDFSDEELTATLNAVSVLQEKDRRDLLIARPNRYSVNFDYGMHFTDPQGDGDTYRRDSRYALEGSFEAIPFLKHEALERFSLFGSFRLNESAIEVGTNNADVTEMSLALGANWYPLYAAYVAEAPVLFFGTYIRSGFATLKAPTSGDQANYTVLSIPGLQAGLRYNFRNHVGLRMVASMETLNLERYESNKLGSILPDTTQLVEGKMAFGLSYLF